jgi:histidyl-tRNA synthetase
MLQEVGDVHPAGPPEAALWRFVRRRALAVFQAHGYREVRPSPIEPAGLAAAGGAVALAIGDGQELRADALVSIAHQWLQTPGVEPFARWMLSGSVFDPAPRGTMRWRSWQAVSGLLIGTPHPAGDAETAALARSLGSDLDLAQPSVAIGTVGDPGDLERWLESTADLRALACATCTAAGDPLRFLSCDDEGCRALATAGPPLREFVGIEAMKHHEGVLATLEASGFAVEDDPRLAFGVGRYRRTVVELRAQSEGATKVVARGGRRDQLVEALGGRPTPAVGLTLGVARASTCVPGGNDGDTFESQCEIFFASRGAAARAWSLRAAANERARGFRVDVELREVGWAEQLQRAERLRARVVVVVGDVERKKGEVAIRDMLTRETRHIPEEGLASALKRMLR